MPDYLPTVGIFSEDSYLRDTLVDCFKSKEFNIKKNPRTIDGIDYFILNLSGQLSLSKYSEFLSRVHSKCLVVLSKNKKGIAGEVLRLNPKISVGILSGRADTIYDYSKTIAKDLLSFGHGNKSFRLKGIKIRHIPKKSKEQVLLPTKKIPRKKNRKTRLNSRITKINFAKKVPFKKFSLAMLGVIFVLSIPALSILVSVLTFYFGIKQIPVNTNRANDLLSVSQISANFSDSLNFGISIYSDTSDIITQSVRVAKNVQVVMGEVGLLTNNITGNKIYDIEDVSTKLSAELDGLYINLGFLKGTIDNVNSFPAKLVREKLVSLNIDVGEYTKKIYSAKEIASNLDQLLGGDTQKKYMVLFQNNMELRPTGGFIGSYAILTLDGGRLTDIVVSDVYSADGQLRGHVEPPSPIKEHLGEGGWYMRDANWNPDFPSTATKIEWFLDKEIDVQVDGVIAIDLHVVQSLLEATGAITLADFGKVITSENLYTVTQAEVENEFFPGSTKKSGFLTALSRQLVMELQNLENDKKLLSLVKIYESLEEGHVQLFVHIPNVQNSFYDLGYDGSVDVTSNCGLRCFWDKYYLIDANLGVNKANFYIQRVQDFFVTVNKNDISHELLVTYTNNAGQILGNTGRYKTYTRLIIPQDASIGGVRLYDEGGRYSDLEYETEDIEGRREIGFLLEVMPGTSERLQISWKLPTRSLEQGGEYRLLVNKQAGTDADPLSVTLKPSELNFVTAIPTPVLTKEGGYLYNTNLRKDFSTRVFLNE